MEAVNILGVYGKLPAYGDFVHRNLPNTFMSGLDEWIQLFVASSHEKLGEQWLDVYLTSPIWRFVLSAGVIDDRHWTGVMLPSVDQVGRYYPLVIARPISQNVNPLEFISVNTSWFEKIENSALLALDGQLDIDELVQQINSHDVNLAMNHLKSGHHMNIDAIQMNMQFTEESLTVNYANMLDSLLLKTMKSYSVWSTTGSENIAPCLFTAQGLPAVSQIPAMLDGQWAQWGWPQTYTANRFNNE